MKVIKNIPDYIRILKRNKIIEDRKTKPMYRVILNYKDYEQLLTEFRYIRFNIDQPYSFEDCYLIRTMDVDRGDMYII